MELILFYTDVLPCQMFFRVDQYAHMFNVLCFMNMLITLFSDVKPALHSWNKLHLVMVYNPVSLQLHLAW